MTEAIKTADMTEYLESQVFHELCMDYRAASPQTAPYRFQALQESIERQCADLAAERAPSQPVALTDEQISDIADDFKSQYMHGGTTFDEFDHMGFARAILAALTPEPAADAKDAARYRWLRDYSLRKTSRPDDAPYVMNPRRSKLYAMSAYRGDALDAAIDEDRLNDMAQHIFEQALIEGDARFADPKFRFSDEFSDECMAKATAAIESIDRSKQA